MCCGHRCPPDSCDRYYNRQKQDCEMDRSETSGGIAACQRLGNRKERKSRPVAKHRRRDESWDLHIAEPHSGYVRVAFYIKAPGLIFVLPSVINANAGAGADSARVEFPIFDPDRGAQ